MIKNDSSAPYLEIRTEVEICSFYFKVKFCADCCVARKGRLPFFIDYSFSELFYLPWFQDSKAVFEYQPHKIFIYIYFIYKENLFKFDWNQQRNFFLLINFLKNQSIDFLKKVRILKNISSFLTFKHVTCFFFCKFLPSQFWVEPRRTAFWTASAIQQTTNFKYQNFYLDFSN